MFHKYYMQHSILLKPQEIIHWFNAIRNVADSERYRCLEAFWAGQIDSKVWLVDTLNKIQTSPANIYIFGGWIGVLASILFQASTFKIEKIRSIDLDPWCEGVADTLCKPHEMVDWNFKARTSDMSSYEYEWGIKPTIVINTSTEHVTQETYNTWWNKIPAGTLVVAQGNNFFSCSEHVRCSNGVEEFCQQNHVVNPHYVGSMPHDLYTRYMAIWTK